MEIVFVVVVGDDGFVIVFLFDNVVNVDLGTVSFGGCFVDIAGVVGIEGFANAMQIYKKNVILVTDPPHENILNTILYICLYMEVICPKSVKYGGVFRRFLCRDRFFNY